MSINWLSGVDPAPRVLVRPKGVASLDEAHSAIELWEHYSGKRLDPAQRQAVEIIMATDRKGNWAASTTGRCMPRQNGKGDEIEVVELHGLVQRAEAILHTVHDAVLLATQTQQRMLGVLEGHKDLRRLIKRRWLGTGQQMIELHNGGIIWYRTRTGGGGRGVDDIDRLVVDEAQHAQEEHLSALTPTMLANENAQLNALGSAGIEGKSEWWWQMRIRALGSDPGRFGFVEHTAEVVSLNGAGVPVQGQIDPTDRAVWMDANPAMHAGRGQGMPFLEEQFRRMDRRSFCREHLGVWDPPPRTGGGGAFDVTQWAGVADPKASRGAAPVFGVDIGEDRLAHVAVAWRRRDGAVQVMLATDPLTPLETPARVSELVQQWKSPVVLGGPSAVLESEVKRSKVISGSDFAIAVGRFDDLLRAGEIRHGNQPELNRAVADASWRPYGTAGERSLQLVNAPTVGPLAAVIRALHGLVVQPARKSAAPVTVSAGAGSSVRTADLSTMQF